jgi:hypothetical protein
MTYNGWNNRETWLVNLHYSNNEYDHDRIHELADEAAAEYYEAYPDAESVPVSPLDSDEEYFVCNLINELADKLKDMVESDVDEALDDSNLSGGFLSDAINDAMSQIDWYEWAENLLSDK